MRSWRADERLAGAALALLAAAYALQVVTPLRLNSDAIKLLLMAESAAAGGPFTARGQETVFPPGYPALVSLLLQAGLAKSWTLVSVNLIFLAIALAAFRRVVKTTLPDLPMTLWLVVLPLCSFVVVKHVTLPLTEFPFAASVFVALAVMAAAGGRSSLRSFLLAVIAAWAICLVAIAVRRIGVALLPPLLFVYASRPEVRQALQRGPAPARVGLIAGPAAAAVVTVVMIASTSTLMDRGWVTDGRGVLGVAGEIARFRLLELGEIAANLPSTKVGLAPVLTVVGLAFLGLVVRGVARQPRFDFVQLFLVSYASVLLLWPYYDPRFWLPVLPLLLAYAAAAFRLHKEASRPARLVVAAYCAAYVLLGGVALGYSTRLSLAGNDFWALYGDDSRRWTYCAANDDCARAWNPTMVDWDVVRLLRRFQ